MDNRIHSFPLWTSLEICAHQNRAKILHLQNHLIDWKCLPLRNSKHTILCHVPHRIVEDTPGFFPARTISESEPPLWKLMPEETRQSLRLFLVSNCYMILHSRLSREVPGFTAKKYTKQIQVRICNSHRTLHLIHASNYMIWDDEIKFKKWVITVESQLSGLSMDCCEIVAIIQNPLPVFAVQAKL